MFLQFSKKQQRPDSYNVKKAPVFALEVNKTYNFAFEKPDKNGDITRVVFGNVLKYRIFYDRGIFVGFCRKNKSGEMEAIFRLESEKDKTTRIPYDQLQEFITGVVDATGAKKKK